MRSKNSSHPPTSLQIGSLDKSDDTMESSSLALWDRGWKLIQTRWGGSFGTSCQNPEFTYSLASSPPPKLLITTLFLLSLFLSFFDVDPLGLYWICYNTVLCFSFFGHEAYGMLAPRQGIEPALPALEGKVRTTGSAENALFLALFCFTCLHMWVRREPVQWITALSYNRILSRLKRKKLTFNLLMICDSFQ